MVKDIVDESAAVQFLDGLIERAVQLRASDIHLEPKDDHLGVRLRIDGILHPHRQQPVSLSQPLASRIKVLARMDIAEKMIPQDGKFSLRVKGDDLDFRCSTFPTPYGEKVVLRILSGATLPSDLAGLGIPADQLLLLQRASLAANGLILSTGPTGSGKTCTQHSVLARLDATRLNITTLEDPIEIRSMRITQAQVNNRKGFTFAAGLRAILRQDPDVILVGEMRDVETAQIAFRASLTGHLVLSTLHTSSTVDTITRLLDMELEPYLVASSLHVVIAQRLVRLLCPLCRVPVQLNASLFKIMGFEFELPSEGVYGPGGCPACANTGYRGRTGLFEVVLVDDSLRELIKQKSASVAYKGALRKRGIPTLRRDGLRKVFDGLTTIDEVLRVT